MNVSEALIESWDRQCRIVKLISERVNDGNKNARPSPDGWPLFEQLAHIHQVRRFHLRELNPELAASLEKSLKSDWSDPIDDLPKLRSLLDSSASAVRTTLESAFAEDKQQMGGYEHPVFFLQHLIWHEGWHVGLMFLAFRLAGEEIPEEWEEAKVWSEWRKE